MANFLLISCRCIIVLFCYFLSLSQSSHGQTLSLLWPSSCRRRRLLKQRFQFDRDLLVVYDPQEKTFWDPHLFILFSSTVTSTDESKEVTSSTERISFSREGLHVNFQGAAVGLEHECVKCTSQTIQRVSLACISWQVLGDDTRAELEERQAVRLLPSGMKLCETVLLPSTPAVWHDLQEPMEPRSHVKGVSSSTVLKLIHSLGKQSKLITLISNHKHRSKHCNPF